MNAKILIVSQNKETTKLISDTLENEGHMVTANDILRTVGAMCREGNFDIVFVDVLIRRMTYSKLVSDIKNLCPETEVVVVTTDAFPKSIIKGEVLDISGYLIRPLTKDKIINITNRALRQGELTRENRRLLFAVTAAKKEWEATVDAIEDPIFVTDFDYTILRANLATFHRLGKGVKDVVGHKCYEVFHCSKHVLDDCPGKRARDSGDPASETMSLRGLKQRLTCSVYPQIFEGGGGLVHYLREPTVGTEQQAEAMAKYERLFDDANIPILFVSLDDYKVVDANQKAIEFFGHAPETISDMDLENLFVESLREEIINNIIEQIEGEELPIRTMILDSHKSEIDVFIIANPIEIGESGFVEIFVIPVELLRGSAEE